MLPSKRQRTDEIIDKGDASTSNLQENPPYDGISCLDDEQLSLDKKVFNDSVHGHIELHPLLVNIIDTPEFQRLRFIKQLGMCYFVYPGAAHNRFEHSLGVSYLAGELARSLQSKQSRLMITPEDILCVEIAGLCHDLGHGPFSHLFDDSFLPKVRPNYKGKHEKLSVDMFEHMLQKNQLRERFADYNLTETDINFIKEQIVGVGKRMVKALRNYVPDDESGPCASSPELSISEGEMLTIVKQDANENYLEVVNAEGERGRVAKSLIEDIWPYKGRGKEKSFLYEIVANKRNGIDVDKWDYFARDSLYLGISNPFDWRRYLKFARVLKEHDGMQICTRDKEITNLYDMFHTRYTLHRRAYHHRVTKILEAMIVEALKEADDHMLIQGKDGKEMKMSESIDDMEAYSKLTDHVMWQILFSTNENLEKSQKLINRILKRELFVCIGQTQLKKNVPSMETPRKLVSQLIDVRENDVRREIYESLKSEAKASLKESDIIIHIANFNYGMGEKDPVDHVKFYSKCDPYRTVEISKIRKDSMDLPREFSERFLRVCIKQTEQQSCEWVKEAFEDWCDNRGLTLKPGEFSATKKPSGPAVREPHARKASKRLDSHYDSTPSNRK